MNWRQSGSRTHHANHTDTQTDHPATRVAKHSKIPKANSSPQNPYEVHELPLFSTIPKNSYLVQNFR